MLSARDKDDLARLRKDMKPQRISKNGFKGGNQVARKHGVFAACFIDDEERDSFLKLRRRFMEDYPSETAADEAALDLVCVYLLRLGRAIKAGEVDYIVKLDGTVRNHLRDLKATRITREGDRPAHRETTPAEWASALLARDPKKKAARENAALENAEKRSDNTGDDFENAGDYWPEDHPNVV